jgi:hypothetical protein
MTHTRTTQKEGVNNPPSTKKSTYIGVAKSSPKKKTGLSAADVTRARKRQKVRCWSEFSLGKILKVLKRDGAHVCTAWVDKKYRLKQYPTKNIVSQECVDLTYMV